MNLHIYIYIYGLHGAIPASYTLPLSYSPIHMCVCIHTQFFYMKNSQPDMICNDQTQFPGGLVAQFEVVIYKTL